jgi:type VI secretion system secreted protein VgrG
MAITQHRRLLEIETPLGKDQLILTGVSGEERVNDLFSFELEMLSPRMSIEAPELLGKQVTFSITSAHKTRWFTGIVSRFVAANAISRTHRVYRAQVVPEAWLLTRRADCRIFQNKSVPDIISEVLSDAGLKAYEAVGLKSHPPHEYCVQYNETDFAFISRLMEEEGIFYLFKHSHGDLSMVLTDDTSAYFDIEESQIEVRPISPDTVDAVQTWERQNNFIPLQWAHTDYDFEAPSKDLLAITRSVVSLQRGGKWEIFDWRGDYREKDRGRDLGKKRIEAHEAGYTVVEGGGTCRFFAPGGKFTIKRCDVESEQGKKWVCAAVYHTAVDTTHLAGSPGVPTYGNSFSCVPDTTLLRSPQKTPCPSIPGAQTALVVGPSGEEIYTDKYGRIRVQFYWDRKGKKDEKSSCWIRVAHNWAGKQWGVIFTPRIGMEVLVEFLEGNPDNPLVTGCVYNAEYMPPWSLPGNKTQSGLVTRSSQNGSADNCNILRFEDKKGEEEVLFHAEKDFKREVEHDDTLEVGNDQKETIKNNRTVEITQGDDKLTIKQGSCTVEALQSITLKVGQSSVTINQAGVSIKGLVLTNDGTTSSTTNAPLITENASGTLTLHGSTILLG